MSQPKQYKLIVAPHDRMCGCPDSLEAQINAAALDGFELREIDLKLHNGQTCWLAVMVKDA